jgi:hypothetical protein
MAKNLGRKYATMDEAERRRFALEEDEGTRELPPELDFEEPRDPDHTGPHFARLREEIADSEHRDGLSAVLDDEQHERAVREAAKRSKRVDESVDQSPGSDVE